MDGAPSSRELARVTAGFAALTIVMTYPQIRFMASRMGEHYDTLFSVWRLAWIAHQLPRDPLHLFDANIFYPRLHTLAYSDGVLLPGVAGGPGRVGAADRGRLVRRGGRPGARLA